MHKKLTRHNLDYEKTIIYVKDQLDIGYVLSEELNLLNFEEGQFFTLLPENVDLNKIYDFFGGLILPKNETKAQTSESSGKVHEDSKWAPTLNEEISFHISEEFKCKNDYAGIFEDVQQELTSPHLEFFYEFGFSCLNQIYYFLSKKDASPELVYTAMSEADAIWHLLFIITEVDSEFIKQFRPGQKINLEHIKKFRDRIRLLALGAYDGEGCIFWEPTTAPQFFSTFKIG